jgi:hypothetical protein
MKYNRIDRRGSVLRLGLAALLVSGGVAGFWGALAQGGMTAWLTSALLAVAVALGAVWQLHTRAARRLQATWDAYAEREIARAARQKTPAKIWITPTRKDVLRSHRAS